MLAIINVVDTRPESKLESWSSHVCKLPNWDSSVTDRSRIRRRYMGTLNYSVLALAGTSIFNHVMMVHILKASARTHGRILKCYVQGTVGVI